MTLHDSGRDDLEQMPTSSRMVRKMFAYREKRIPIESYSFFDRLLYTDLESGPRAIVYSEEKL